jgi:hypothetical protein
MREIGRSGEARERICRAVCELTEAKASGRDRTVVAGAPLVKSSRAIL